MYTSCLVFLSITQIMNFNLRIILHVGLCLFLFFYFVVICIVQRIDVAVMRMRNKNRCYYRER